MTAPIGSTGSTGVADPTGAASSIGSNDSMGQDDFLKLLVAQMKNQDPTDPMKAQDLAAQLAQFSSLNQLIGINTALSTQNDTSQGIEQAITMNTATSTLGRTVTAIGNQFEATGDGAPSVTFDAGSAGAATVHVFDSSGTEVATEDLGNVGVGRHTMSLGDDGAKLPSGAYTYKIDLTDATGNAGAVTTYTVAKVDSLQATANGVMLGAGALSIPFSSVIAISSGS